MSHGPSHPVGSGQIPMRSPGSGAAPSASNAANSMQSPSSSAMSGMGGQVMQQGPAGAAGAGPTEMNMANTKEKTPMCHLNELARFNHLQPQYELLEETGPAHEKQFTVKLLLGTQKFEAKGTSIKKAQHKAAEQALLNCSLPAPKPRPPRAPKAAHPNPNALTATVELNSKAMKAGVVIRYAPIGPDPGPAPYHPHHHHNYHHHNFNYRGGRGGYRHPPPRSQGPGMPGGPPMPPMGMGGPGGMRPQGPGMGGEPRGPGNYRGHGPRHNFHPRYPGPRPSFFIKVTVGNRDFIGEGRTRKDARQNAALMALKSLEQDPLPDCKDEAVSTADPPVNSVKAKEEDGLKSDISIVYEKAHQHNLSVNFKVTEEKGPPHMKNFKVECLVGEHKTEGAGNSKKNAKRKAAEGMIKNLQMLPSMPKVERPRPYFQLKKKKSKSLIKTRATNPEYEASGLNPISRLVQILQAINKKEPVFTVVEDHAVPEHNSARPMPRNRRREFTIQVTADGKSCIGKGPKKKAAKRAAAEEMLREMGYSSAPPALKTSSEGDENTSGSNERKVTFKEDTDKKVGEKKKLESPIPGHKLAPGLLPMMPGVNTTAGFPGPTPTTPPMNQKPTPIAPGLNRAPGAPVSGAPVSKKASPSLGNSTADIARELLTQGVSPTANALARGRTGGLGEKKPAGPRQQLEFLAAVQGLSIKFTDLPEPVSHHTLPTGYLQTSKTERMSQVTVLIEPKLVCHGAGPTLEASHDVAAIAALRSLAGIDHDDDMAKKAQNAKRVPVTVK